MAGDKFVRLPNATAATISPAKIADYLLSATHPHGRHKAAFFCRFGFDSALPQALADALRLHAIECPVARREDTPFGVRYVVEGPLSTPSDRRPNVRTVWFVAIPGGAPCLATAYPLETNQ